MRVNPKTFTQTPIKVNNDVEMWHVYPAKGGWTAQHFAPAGLKKHYMTKQAAVSYAQRGQSTGKRIVVVHGVNGRVNYMLMHDGTRL